MKTQSKRDKERSSGPPAIVIAGKAMTHRLGDFLFDGAVLAKDEQLPAYLGSSGEEKGSPALQPAPPDLSPMRMFQGKDDLLASVILRRDSSGSSKKQQLSDEDLARTGKRWQSQILTSEAQAETAYYRWQNRDASSTVPPPRMPPQFVLVEESRLQELTRFETSLKRERSLVEDSTAGEMTTKNLFEQHRSLDPRVPSAEVRRAMKIMAENRLKFLTAEWGKLQANWSKHAAHFGFNTPHVYRQYAGATSEELAAEAQLHDGSGHIDSWLLKGCPPHERVKKLRQAKAAAETFLQRYDRDTMLFEDDRSFLVQQAFEASSRALDYQRYCELAEIFGPMPAAEWAKSKSRPGLRYYIRATVNATKIQRVWDVYWSTYKLHRFIAARRMQTKFRAWYAYKSLHPLVILRLRFGKRTYYFWCWAQWQRYNFLVKSIRTRLEYMRTYWRNLCFRSWRTYADAKIARKRGILDKFRARFDARASCFLRMKLFTAKSRRIKCWLRRTWNVPQLTLWIEYVAASKRRKELMKVIVPVQAFFRMVRWRRFYHKMRRARPYLQKFMLLLMCKGQIKTQREELVLEKFQTWGPEELARREAAKAETERRRLLREQQVADEKGQSALSELRKHLRSYTGKTQLQAETQAFLAQQQQLQLLRHGRGHSRSVSRRKARELAESSLLTRCFAAHVELNVHEYRTSQGPHIVCADPTCKLTFWSDESYLQHGRDMCSETEPDDNDEGKKQARRGSAMLAKALSMKKAADVGLAAAKGKKMGSAKKNKNGGGSLGKKHAAVAATEAGGASAASNVREHSMVPFAEFHLLLKSDLGRDALRQYLSRRFGVGPLVNTLDCWVDVAGWRRLSAHSDSFVKRAVVIYENYLRTDEGGAARPIEIDLDDGDLRADFDDDDEDETGAGVVNWYDALLAKFAAVKSRQYEGFYQAAFFRGPISRLLGLKGRKYQRWTDATMLSPDVFDGVHFACLLALHRLVWLDASERELYLASREHAKVLAADEALRVKRREALLEDCRVARAEDIRKWVSGFCAEETTMKHLAYEAVDLVLGKEITRLLSLGVRVGVREKVFHVQHGEQSIYEENMALCDDAVDWAADGILDHVFDFYARRLLETMLTHDDMVEGMMEYAGMLKNKKLKKHLEVTTAPIGVRVDMTWFKECLQRAIAEDLRSCPRDYIGCVRLLQRWFRGVAGRNRVRKIFINLWAKKWDPERERFYWVNLESGDIGWERPFLFFRLYPNRKW